MRYLSASLLGLLLSLPLVAQAQYNPYLPYSLYSEQIYNEGPGFKVLHDGLVVHPGVAADLGYDSNVLLANDAVGAGLFRLRLHLDLATLPPQRQDPDAHPFLEFRFGGAFEFRQFFRSTDTVRLNNEQQYAGYSTIYVGIRPKDPLSLHLYNDLIFTPDARSQQFFAPTYRIYERVGALGVFKPQGRPLEFGLGDSFQLDYFFDRDAAYGRSLSNEVNFYTQWQALPRTNVRFDIRSTYINHYDQLSFLMGRIPSSVPLHLTLGLSTLFLPSLGATIYAGYGNSFHYEQDKCLTLTNSNDCSYSNFIGGAELRLRLPPRLRLAAGWARDFFDALFGTYYSDDRLYLDYDHYVVRGLSAHLHFSTFFRHYGALVPGSPLTPVDGGFRNDVLLSLIAELDYRVLSWMELGVSYSFLDDITSVSTQIGPAAFVKHAVLFKIDIAY